MNKTTKRILASILGISLVMMAAGCGGSNNGNSASSGNGDAAKTKKVTLTITHYFDPSNAEPMEVSNIEAFKLFKQNHPEIELKEEMVAHDSYDTKVKTLAAANELPDVFLISSSMVSNFVDNGLLAPVNDMLDADKEWKDGYLGGTLDNYTVDGKIYGLPNSAGPSSIIYYNKALFAKAGITEFPKDWTGFMDAINKLKSAGITPIALGNKGKWVAQSCIISTLADRITGTDWFYSLKNKKGAKFTDPEFVEALTKLQDLAKAGAFNSDMNSIDNNQQRTLYYNGKAAMFIEGGWAINGIDTDAPQEIKDNTELALIPAVEGGKGAPTAVSGGPGYAYSVNANLSEDKKEAVSLLLKTMTGKEEANIAASHGDVPTTKTDNFDKSKLTPLLLKEFDMVNTSQYVPIYDSHLSPAIIESINSGLQELLIQATTPQKLAEKLQKDYESM